MNINLPIPPTYKLSPEEKEILSDFQEYTTDDEIDLEGIVAIAAGAVASAGIAFLIYKIWNFLSGKKKDKAKELDDIVENIDEITEEAKEKAENYEASELSPLRPYTVALLFADKSSSHLDATTKQIGLCYVQKVKTNIVLGLVLKAKAALLNDGEKDIDKVAEKAVSNTKDLVDMANDVLKIISGLYQLKGKYEVENDKDLGKVNTSVKEALEKISKDIKGNKDIDVEEKSFKVLPTAVLKKSMAELNKESVKYSKKSEKEVAAYGKALKDYESTMGKHDDGDIIKSIKASPALNKEKLEKAMADKNATLDIDGNLGHFNKMNDYIKLTATVSKLEGLIDTVTGLRTTHYKKGLLLTFIE